MKETAILKIVIRTGTTKGANNLLRRKGYLPCNIYGKGIQPISIAVRKDEFKKCINKSGRNSVYKLESQDQKSYTVMIKEIQISPIYHEYYHVDFQQVILSEEIKTDVLIKITGTELLDSKRLFINRQMDSILVSGLPQNIPEAIEIDASNLKAGEVVKIGDLKLPDGIHVELTPEHIVLSASESKVQEETPEEEQA